ncbi:TetR family transcriptional regulator [Anaerobacterium chartisolvens]|uniref:TetR family transcriptional regulator n=1 Tax=Anaerobacterium chartisolvens TaxID=1297424 RepID=A0A369BBE8_9FIRM|nr:TetR/AcrR family transcriptional regulator [Anaerobacterium chartisolvens]RCX17886.1 TetR family transcriptional regulator [Anaerobacterium chartisolvens]
MNGYKRRTQKKRDAIVKAAQELFSEKGIAAVSVTDIAAKANVSRVTLFKYFGDKEALAKEAMFSWIELLMKEYETILSSTKPFHKKLLELLNTRLAGRERIGERFIHSTAWDDPELLRLIKEMTATYALPIIMKFMEEGKRSGDIDSSLDNEAILAYFSAFGPIVRSPEYIKKGKEFQISMFNLFMGGLVKNWYQKTDTAHHTSNT